MSPCPSPRWFLIQYFSKSRWIASFHYIFGRPLFLFPGISVLNTFLSKCSSSLLITCPHQLVILSVIFLEACAILVVPRKGSLQILSLRVTRTSTLNPSHTGLTNSLRRSCDNTIWNRRQIVEITHDWSQRSWVNARGKSVATRSMIIFNISNLRFQIVWGND